MLGALAVAGNLAAQVQVEQVEVKKEGRHVAVGFSVPGAPEDMRSRQKMVLRPYLYAGADTLWLPEAQVYGKIRYKRERQEAALAGDRNMIEMFENPDNDIHTMTAAEAYGIAPDQVTPEQRRHAKVINFGVLYGMSPHGLAEATGMDLSSASAFIRRYFAIRKPIRDFIDNTLELAEKRGYVETLFGRRRPTPDVKSANFMVREAAKRAAANMPIQGTEADLMKMAMLKIEQIDGASQIMQVHDSIMVECNQADAERIASEMKQVMEQIYPQLDVRLLVDIKIGRSWVEV